MNMHRTEIDFPEIAAEVTQALLGEPNRALSTPNELRFGSRGSLSVDLKRAVWHDHENGTGGGMLVLIARETGASKGGTFDWLRERGFAPAEQTAQGRREIVATYPYRDEAGQLLFEVCRFEPKTFRQRAPDGRGGWNWSTKGVRRVLYRLPEIIAASSDALVFIVEGERDADRLAGLGLVATTCPEGAGKWRDDFAKALTGRCVAILPDNDEAGRDHAAAVLKSLQAEGIKSAVLTLDGLPHKGDVSDWLAAGGDVETLTGLAGGALREAPAAPTRPDRVSEYFSAATFKGEPVPPREFVVPEIVPNHTVTLLGGDGGAGKSLLALQLSVAVSADCTWLGLPVKRGGVIYITAEDTKDELHRRTNDILASCDRNYDDIKDLTMRSLAGEDALLAIDTQLALIGSELFKELEKRAADERPALIVIDTLADVYPANENDRAKVRQFVGILRGLAIRQECAVMLLGHPSLTGLNSGSGTSGSTAWNNSVRSRLYLSRIVQKGHEPDPDKRVLTTKKANYGRVGGEFNMTWRNGVFVPDSAPQGLDAMAANAKEQRVFLKLLTTFTAQGRRVNATGGTQYAPKVFSEHPAAEGMTRRALKPAMETLLHLGRIVIETEGPPSRRISYLAEARR